MLHRSPGRREGDGHESLGLRSLERELRATTLCNQAMLRAVDEQSLMMTICRIVCEEAGYLLSWVGYLEEDEAKSIRPVGWFGFEAGYLEQASITWAEVPLGMGPTGTAARTGRTTYVQDFTTDPMVAPWRDNALRRGYRSSIGLPLKDEEGRTFGVLTIYSEDAAAFIPEEIRLLETLAGDLAFGIATLRARMERKQAGEQLQAQDAFIRNILESIDIGFCVTDRDFRVQAVNKAYSEWFGLDTEATLGRHCYELSHHATRPCDESGEDCPVKRTFQTGRPQGAVHTHATADGTKRTFEVKSYPFTDATGQMVSAIETFTDVTEKTQLEDQLRHVQKMEAMGQLAGGVAHDFNNILQAIMGFGSLMEMRTPPEDPRLPLVEQILASARRAADLTRGLLAFSRKQVLQPKPVELNGIVDNVEKLLRRLLGADLDLVIRKAGEALVVIADEGQIEQVLMNLATNGRDAMPEGGTLTLSTERVDLGEAFLSTHQDGQPGPHALITVSDTGLGMDEATRRRIFEPFFTTKEVGRGTGLGLSIVYGIVKQHGGLVDVASTLGQGSAFRIYLPLVSLPPQAHGDREEAAPAGGTETILLAEDDEGVRAMAHSVLGSFGYRVLLAKDGLEALQRFQEHQGDIDLLLLDVIMPGKNGKDVLDAIRASHPDIKALLISGYTPDFVQQRGMAGEGTRLLQKPMNPTDLLRGIREALQTR